MSPCILVFILCMGPQDHNTVQVQGNACTCECVSLLCVHVSVVCMCYECMHVSVNVCVCVYRKAVLVVGGGRAAPAPPPVPEALPPSSDSPSRDFDTCHPLAWVSASPFLERAGPAGKPPADTRFR